MTAQFDDVEQDSNGFDSERRFGSHDATTLDVLLPRLAVLSSPEHTLRSHVGNSTDLLRDALGSHGGRHA